VQKSERIADIREQKLQGGGTYFLRSPDISFCLK